ncbi:MAG: hypothetical protein B6D63_03420 [Candidatus Latescibacteria bacterium 4484_7]|nr:MAG: hypothetical protein B6D63_03420 [Candidatus Latescibacteria bacterium 4484_7]
MCRLLELLWYCNLESAFWRSLGVRITLNAQGAFDVQLTLNAQVSFRCQAVPCALLAFWGSLGKILCTDSMLRPFEPDTEKRSDTALRNQASGIEF